MERLTRRGLLLPAIGLLVVGIALGGLIIGVNPVRSQSERTSVPNVAVYPAVAELHANTAMVLLGSGFEPGEQVTILLGDVLGVQTDLSSSEGFLDPLPVADEGGNFASKFQVGRMERVSAEQAWSFTAMDADATEVLATAPVAFCDPQGRSRKAPYPRGAPDYAENPDDPRPAPHCQGRAEFEYPEKPEE